MKSVYEAFRKTGDEIINSALNEYCVEIVGRTGTWQRSFIAAPDLKTARFLAKGEKLRFIANRADKRANTFVKRVCKK